MTDTTHSLAPSELILGGQKSGKSRRAETLARQWLAQSAAHNALFVATAQPWDGEMRGRITRHQRERTERVPGMATLEEPYDLVGVLQRRSHPHTLIVVDCLTLWLTNWLMPAHTAAPDPNPSQPLTHDWQALASMLAITVKNAAGPLVLVGNEIGLGVIPLGPQVREFVDALGSLNQQIAQACARVTLMAAGLPLTLKESTLTGSTATSP